MFVESRVYIAIAAVLLVAGITAGAVLGNFVLGPITLGGQGSQGGNSLLNQLEQLAQSFHPYTLGGVLFIYSHNLLTAAISCFAGPLLLIAPIGVLAFNGFILGWIGVAAATQKGILFALEGLMPHGIFELTALVLASAAGLRFGIAAIKKAFSNENKPFALKPEFYATLKLFAVAAVLLLIAAMLETFLTPYLLGIQ